MIRISQILRRLAAEVEEEAPPEKSLFKAEEAKIFFSAPSARHPESKTLDLNVEPAKQANFQWVAYQLLFSVDRGGDTPDYYVYHVDLKSAGDEEPPAKVFKSDSKFSGRNKDKPSDEVVIGEVTGEFPDILKGPNLWPAKLVQTNYTNTDKSDRSNPEYSSEEFKRFFDNEYYIVLNPQKKELKNPYGKSIGVSEPKTPSEKVVEAFLKMARIYCEKCETKGDEYYLHQDIEKIVPISSEWRRNIPKAFKDMFTHMVWCGWGGVLDGYVIFFTSKQARDLPEHICSKCLKEYLIADGGRIPVFDYEQGKFELMDQNDFKQYTGDIK